MPGDAQRLQTDREQRERYERVAMRGPVGCRGKTEAERRRRHDAERDRVAKRPTERVAHGRQRPVAQRETADRREMIGVECVQQAEPAAEEHRL